MSWRSTLLFYLFICVSPNTTEPFAFSTHLIRVQVMMEEIEKLTVVQLRRNLDDANLDKSGNKADLVERWYKHNTGAAVADDEVKESDRETEEKTDSIEKSNSDEEKNKSSEELVS